MKFFYLIFLLSCVQTGLCVSCGDRFDLQVRGDRVADFRCSSTCDTQDLVLSGVPMYRSFPELSPLGLLVRVTYSQDGMICTIVSNETAEAELQSICEKPPTATTATSTVSGAPAKKATTSKTTLVITKGSTSTGTESTVTAGTPQSSSTSSGTSASGSTGTESTVTAGTSESSTPSSGTSASGSAGTESTVTARTSESSTPSSGTSASGSTGTESTVTARTSESSATSSGTTASGSPGTESTVTAGTSESSTTSSTGTERASQSTPASSESRSTVLSDQTDIGIPTPGETMPPCVDLSPEHPYGKEGPANTEEPTPVPTKLICRVGWLLFKNSCYHRSNEIGSFADGKTYCQLNGGDYFKADSLSELDYITSRLNYDTWIGATDANKEGSFVWSKDDSSLAFSKWTANEPNNLDNEDCVVSLSVKRGQWNDDQCHSSYRYLCEMDADEVPLDTPETCQKGYSMYDGSCYYIDSEDLTWNEGQDTCEDRLGDLAKISNYNEWSYVSSLLSKDTWTGLNDIVDEGYFVWNMDGSHESNDDRSYWVDGEPNDLLGKEDCVQFWNNHNYKFNDVGCDRNMNTACETSTVIINPVRLSCPPYWERVDSWCYHVSDKEMTWQKGRSYCQNQGGTYAAVQSQQINDVIRDLAGDDVWIGLNDIQKEGKFIWESGKTYAYTNWDRGEPNNNWFNEDCTELLHSERKWNDKNCGNSFKVACMKRAVVG